jgi:hypothetical protein
MHTIGWKTLLLAGIALPISFSAVSGRAATDLSGARLQTERSSVLTATAGPTASPACSGALNALDLSWDHHGFETPSKPAQMRVSGADGTAISGQAYGDVTEQMRLAAADEKRGDFIACLKSVQRAQADLPSPATALLAQRTQDSSGRYSKPHPGRDECIEFGDGYLDGRRCRVCSGGALTAGA